MKREAYIVLTIWIFLTLFMIFDANFLVDSYSLVDVLGNSSFARIMFTDIGAVSTVLAYWIAFHTEYKGRYIVAILTMFIGSFAFLPYLAYYLYYKK